MIIVFIFLKSFLTLFLIKNRKTRIVILNMFNDIKNIRIDINNIFWFCTKINILQYYSIIFFFFDFLISFPF
jgi:hypothetical protein